MARFGWIAALIGFLLASMAAAPAEVEYDEQVAKWRQQFDADLIAEGWLVLVGREKVPEGTSSLGSSPNSNIVLPLAAPKRVGQLIRRGAAFEFSPAAGAHVSIDGRPATTEVVVSTEQGNGKIEVESLSLAVRQIAGDYYLSIEDANSPAIAAFRGTAWFPIDPSYRVPARFLPYDKPQEIVLALTFESATKTFTSTGAVEFHLNGRLLTLQSFVESEELFLIFQDETNGAETYGGGRYLLAPLPKDGLTTLDFNKAFNPYCAVNPYVICAVTPSQNRLPVRISAGAKFSN